MGSNCIVVFTSESHDTESCSYVEFIVINKGQGALMFCMALFSNGVRSKTEI